MNAVERCVLILWAVSCAVGSIHHHDPPPVSLLVTRTRTTSIPLLDLNETSRNESNQTTFEIPDLTHALGTMDYHRSKMNEYLCHNYLAEEILTDLTPLQSRSDEDPGNGPMSSRKEQDHMGRTMGQEALLKDQGSQSYKQWLERSAQLQDLWSGGGQGQGQSTPHGFETGDVTGYATMAGGKGDPAYGPSHDGGPGDPWPPTGHSGWQDFSGEAPSEWAWEGEAEEDTFGKGLGFKDVFDLAISALAFLAFGLFVLNIIIACFSKKASMKVMMEAATEASTRKRRDAESERLNELARRVLTSIDKLQELQEEPDHTKTGCLAYTLCDNNKFSRALPDNNRIWLPVWSLGMSWLAGRRLADHLRASALGFGDADCRALYPRCAVDAFP